MHKRLNLTKFLLVLVVSFSCNNESSENSQKVKGKDVIKHQKSDLSWLVDLGINKMHQQNSDNLFIADDTTLFYGSNIFSCLKILNPNFNQTQENISKSNLFSLKRGKYNHNYIVCEFGKSKNKYQLEPIFISDTVVVMIAYERIFKGNSSLAIRQLASLIYFESTSKEIVSLTFNSFFSQGKVNLSFDNLNTVSILDISLYETYMMYFYKQVLKFSIAVTYDIAKNRKDKIYLPDLNHDKEKYKEHNDCFYKLKDFDKIESFFRQRNKFCGMPIFTHNKVILDNIPSWCVDNRIY